MISVVGRIAKIPQLSFVLQLSSVSSTPLPVYLSLSISLCFYVNLLLNSHPGEGRRELQMYPQTKDKTSL